jgi:hypothetical protein
MGDIGKPVRETQRPAPVRAPPPEPRREPVPERAPEPEPVKAPPEREPARALVHAAGAAARGGARP